jgi:hypothetical protein
MNDENGRGIEAMKIPVCSKHNVPKQWRLTSFVYDDEGISVCVPGVFGWVCPEGDEETAFPPETVDELITTVSELAAAARRSRERRSNLTQYVISVGSGVGSGVGAAPAAG